MHIDDTIAAISTPVGPGGIGIVRVSGKEAFHIADSIFRPSGGTGLKESPTHRILYGHIINPSDGEIIDEVLVSVMRAPKTYTRQDIVEINCHGGSLPVRRVLELLLAGGARHAGPGEFTQRAFLNGRIDLAQAEAVMDVINAMTVQSQKTAMEQLGGGLSGRVEALRQQLVELTAFVEAYIDFPEEDIEALSAGEMVKMAEKIKDDFERLIEGSRYGRILREGLRTAIIGRPNVGKSSLLNALLEQDRAIVTELPGTTRDVIEDYLNLKGLPVKIMDTAGIRDVEDKAEQEGVRRSLEAMRAADLVLVVMDAGRDPGGMDRELVEKSDPDKTILVVNKTDIASSDLIGEFGGRLPQHVRISAKKGEGLDRLKDVIVETALRGGSGGGSHVVTNSRHLHALERALASIDTFISELSTGTPPEFLSVELRDALDAVGEIIGITTPDEILDKIFGSFCIGK